MAVKAQPGAREAIQHLSSILTDCYIPKVPSESFRQAKFNRDEATGVLWTLLLNIIQLLHFLESRTVHEDIRDSVRYHSLLSTSSDTSRSQTATLVVRKYLLSLGYSRVEFYCTSFDSGSRELLMALGWLLHKSRLIEKLYAYHLGMASATRIPFRANKAFVMNGVVEESESIEAEMSELMNNLSQIGLRRKAVDRYQPNDIMMRMQKLAWMRGRLWAKWKSALISQTAYLRLAHRLHKCTLTQQQSRTSDKRPHLNVHELFLLRYPEQLSSYLKRMEHHMSCLQRLVQWQMYEPVFWQWMDSVLDLHERERATLLEEQEEQAGSANLAKIHKANRFENQLENLERLKDKVQVLEREVYGLLEKHRPYLEKIQRVWQLKAKTVHHKEVVQEYVENGKKFESLLSLTNQQLQFKPGRVRQATSTAETLTMQDRAVYVIETSTKVPPRKLAYVPMTSVEHQQSVNAKLLHESRCFYRQILSELERAQSLIQHRKEDIHRQLLLREQTFSMSVCKIEK